MRHLYLLLFFLLMNSVLSAQLMSSLSKYTSEIAVTKGHIEILNQEEAIISIKKRFVILNEHSEANQFQVGYDPDNKIIDIDANIYDLEGNKIRRVKKSEIRDVLAFDGISIYTENRIRYIELSHSQYPYVVEFSYSKKVKGIDFAGFPNWFFQERSTSQVEQSTFSLTIPKGLDFQYKMYNLDLDPVIEQGEKETTYTWTARDLPGFIYEPYSPPAHEIFPILRLTPADFIIDGHEGSMKTWKEYGTFMHDLWNGREAIPKALSNEIQTIIAPATSDREKIQLLYQYMQENMRYVSVQLGIGGWQPFTASHVDEYGYGDCKALSNYMKAMLNEIGMESYPVIVAAGDQQPYEIEDDFVDPDFNHAILYVPQEDVWLECTSSFAPAGYLGSFCNDRKVLLITPEGGQLARTPKLSTEENITKEKASVRIGNDGSAQLSYQADFTGIPHEKWRRTLHLYTKEELENEVREQGALPNVQFDSLSVQDDVSQPVVNIHYSAFASRYASKAGKRLFVPVNLICPQKYIPAALEERKRPIVIPSGNTRNTTITFTIPEGYKIESLPKNIALNSIFGSYQLNFSQTDRQVVFERKFLFLDGTYPVENYKDMRSFFLDIKKYDGAKMVLVRE